MVLHFPTENLETLNAELGLWRVKNFFNQEILTYLEKYVLPQEFRPKEYHKVDDQYYFNEHIFFSFHTNVIKTLLEDDSLIQSLSSLTHNPNLTSCKPRFYKFYPKKESGFGWHGDNSEGRTLGFSVNLSQKPYEGGYFMIRRTDDHAIQAEFQNLGYGDAIFFNIRKNLVHCVSEVTGSEERVACAGWYLRDEIE